MIRTVVVAIAISGLFTLAGFAKSPEEKAAETLQAVAGYIEAFMIAPDRERMGKAYSGIEKTWQAYTRIAGPNHESYSSFALIRARAATNAKSKATVVSAWRNFLSTLNTTRNQQQQVSLNIEAAHAAAYVEDFEAAKQFFAAARAFAITRGENADNARLFMRIRELSVLGASMPWRGLRDALIDLRKFAATFPMWTLPRLESVLAETEIRIKYEPEHAEKREELSRLKAEIALISDGMADRLPTNYLTRVRTVYYALEDYYNL